jgi:hypothetical protein
LTTLQTDRPVEKYFDCASVHSPEASGRRSLSHFEQYSEQIKTIAGYPIRVTSYRLWDTFYAKTAVALDGMGGWFARSEGSTQVGAEANVIAEAEWLLAKRR